MGLTVDAVIFGLAYLNGPKSTLSFGGVGAGFEITDRARSALDCLIAEGFAEISEPTDGIPGREFYRGKGQLGTEAKRLIRNPFDEQHRWTTFAPAQIRLSHDVQSARQGGDA